jgi:hypothetical protein
MDYLLERLRLEGKITDKLQENVNFVRRFIRCIVLARLLVFNHLQRKLGAAFQPLDWMLLQLFPPKFMGRDFFKELVIILRSLPEKELESQLQANQLDSHHVFLDEAQILCELYPGSFDGTEGTKGRPLYTTVCKSLIFSETARVSVCAIGTGLALDTIKSLNSSNSFKGSSVPAIHILQFQYKTSEDVYRYLSRFFDIPDKHRYFCDWLVGRPRISASFIETVFEKGLSDETFQLFIQRQTLNAADNSIYGKILQFAKSQRSVKDPAQISRLLENLKRAVVNYFFASEVFYCSDAAMFEAGFGILHCINELLVSVCEPIVLMAAYNFFYGRNPKALHQVPANIMSTFQRNPSVLGFLFEMMVPNVVGTLLKMDASQRIAAFGGKIWRYDSLEIWRPEPAFFNPLIRSEEHISLDLHRNSPQCDFLALAESRGADFVTSVAMNGMKIGELTVQVKFRKNFNQNEALRKSTWKPFEYDPNLDQFRVLLAYPKETKFKLFTAQKKMFTLIIDKRNAEHFFTRDELRMFDYLKGSTEHLDDFDQICDEYNLE